MPIAYDLKYEINLGNFSPKVNDFITSLNDTLTTCGVDSKLKCTSIIKGTLTAEKIMTKSQKEQFMRTFNEIAEKEKSGIKLLSMRCKSSESKSLVE